MLGVHTSSLHKICYLQHGSSIVMYIGVFCTVLQKAALIYPTRINYIRMWFQKCIQMMFCVHGLSSWCMLSSTQPILLPDGLVVLWPWGCIFLTRVPLPPTEATNELLGQIKFELKEGAAFRWWMVRRKTFQNQCIYDGNIEDEPKKVSQPLRSWTTRGIVRPQLVIQANASHILVVCKDGCWHVGALNVRSFLHLLLYCDCLVWAQVWWQYSNLAFVKPSSHQLVPLL